MSFNVRPLGLVQMSNFAQFAASHEADEFAAGTSISCNPPPPNGAYTVRTSASSHVDWEADPATMAFSNPPVGDQFTDLTFAPYYALSVNFIRPYSFGFWTNPQACRDTPPFFDEPPTSEATVDGELFAPDELLNGFGVSVPVTASNVTDPDWTITGYLVNPDPVWPSPDSEGNTFGRVLWTADQITAVSGRINVESGPTIEPTNAGVLTVSVEPYRLADDPPAEGYYQCIVGSA